MPDTPDDLDERLAQRLRALESRVPSAEPPAPGTRPARTRRWRWLLGGAGVAAVVAGALLGAALLRPPTDDQVGVASPTPSSAPSTTATPASSPTPRETAPPPSQAPSPTATASPTPPSTSRPSGAADVAWSENLRHAGTAHGIVWDGERFIAVGTAGGRAAAWTSTDGTVWLPSAPIDPPPEDDPDAGGRLSAWSMSFAIPYNGQLLGLGWERVGCCDGSQIALWTSSDGTDWTNVPTRGSSIDTYHVPADAVVSPSGELVLAATTGLGTGTSIWITSDGSSWTETAFSAEGSGERIDAMAASPSVMLAVGTGGEGAGEPTAAVWRSTDGRTWTRLEAHTDLGAWPIDIAYDDAYERFVVVGQRADGTAGAWLTEDGGSWTAVRLSDEAARLTSVAAAEGLIVATGTLGAEEGPAIPTAWSSHDGHTWHVVPIGTSRMSPSAIGVGADGIAVVALTVPVEGALSEGRILVGVTER